MPNCLWPNYCRSSSKVVVLLAGQFQNVKLPIKTRHVMRKSRNLQIQDHFHNKKDYSDSTRIASESFQETSVLGKLVKPIPTRRGRLHTTYE